MRIHRQRSARMTFLRSIAANCVELSARHCPDPRQLTALECPHAVTGDVSKSSRFWRIASYWPRNVRREQHDQRTTGAGSLRDAIMSSNGTAAGLNTISFSTGLSGTIRLQSSLPTITHPVIIDGPAPPAAPITIYAAWSRRKRLVLDLASDGSTIENLTIAGFLQGIGTGQQSHRRWYYCINQIII